MSNRDSHPCDCFGEVHAYGGADCIGAETPVSTEFWGQTHSMKVEFGNVDPEVLGILTGGVLGKTPAPTFAIEVISPGRKRTFWEWLRRKPKHLPYHAFIPNARLAEKEETDD